MNRLLLLTVLLLLGACSSFPIDKDGKQQYSKISKEKLKSHFIYIDKNGDLIDPYSKKLTKMLIKLINM